MTALRRRPAAAPAVRAPWGWAVAGVLIGAAFMLVTQAPARWLAAGLARATGGMLLLTEPQGSVWSGSARLVLTGGAGSQDSAALPGRLEWQLRPSWNGLRLQINATCCTPQPLLAKVRVQLGQVRVALQDSRSQWPAAVLAGLGTPWNTLQPQGQLMLQTQGLEAVWSAGRMALAGRAQLDAMSMSSRLSTLRPMGSYRLELTGGEVPALALSTLQGPLQLTGSGQWVSQRLRFAGEASAAPDREAALANLLNIIGRRSGARSLITVG